MGEAPLGDAWEDTAIHLPPETAASGYRNILTDETVSVSEEAAAPALRVSEVLKRFPVALLALQSG
jgi:maltooligosyltrehalose synthase